MSQIKPFVMYVFTKSELDTLKNYMSIIDIDRTTEKYLFIILSSALSQRFSNLVVCHATV